MAVEEAVTVEPVGKFTLKGIRRSPGGLQCTLSHIVQHLTRIDSGSLVRRVSTPLSLRRVDPQSLQSPCIVQEAPGPIIADKETDFLVRSVLHHSPPH
jgi:hypothetical protein